MSGMGGAWQRWIPVCLPAHRPPLTASPPHSRRPSSPAPCPQVAVSGSVVVRKLMEVERYSHVMHISSTVTGELLPQLDAWDALRAALPAGTVSGAPKVGRGQHHGERGRGGGDWG